MDMRIRNRYRDCFKEINVYTDISFNQPAGVELDGPISHQGRWVKCYRVTWVNWYRSFSISAAAMWFLLLISSSQLEISVPELISKQFEIQFSPQRLLCTILN